MLAIVCLAASACASAPAPQPATPTPAGAQAPADTTRKGYTAADVRFMQNMIGHHAQALLLSELVESRTPRDDFHLMAERIRLSQESEIAQMQRWLQQRGEQVPPADASSHVAMGHGAPMPGMLTEAELNQLRSARGVEFEKLFLQLMIKHHEGALQMVRELYAAPGSGQEPELFILASDVDADQTAEIRRMRALLDRLP
ncbi:MAG TPA: DUF305 domain-containing protein [Longimicrobiales bacterium]|nr:DUF305 domain-containing protein [Longimicrobiales bacterium]